MKTINVNAIEQTETAQEPQSTVFWMANGLLSEDGNSVQQLHTFVKCKDFLGDYLYCVHENKGMEAYDFEVTDPISKDQLSSMCLLVNTTHTEDQLENLLKLLNSFERRFKFKKLTTVKKAEGDFKCKIADKYYAILLSPEWYKSLQLYSFVCGFIRLGYFGDQVKQATSALNLIDRIAATNSGNKDAQQWYSFKRKQGLSIILDLVKGRDQFDALIWSKYYSPDVNAFEYSEYQGDAIHYGHGMLGFLSSLGKNPEHINPVVRPHVELYYLLSEKIVA